MKNNMETLIVRKPNRPENERLKKQDLEEKKRIREMKQSVSKMYQNKVLHDAYYINYNNIVEEVI